MANKTIKYTLIHNMQRKDKVSRNSILTEPDSNENMGGDSNLTLNSQPPKKLDVRKLDQLDISRHGSTCTLNIGAPENSSPERRICSRWSLFLLSVMLSLLALSFSVSLAVWVFTQSPVKFCIPYSVLDSQDDFSDALVQRLRRISKGGVEEVCARSKEEAQLMQELIQKRLDLATIQTPNINTHVPEDSSRVSTPRKRNIKGPTLAHLIFDEHNSQNLPEGELVIKSWKKRHINDVYEPNNVFEYNQNDGAFVIHLSAIYEVYSHIHLDLTHSKIYRNSKAITHTIWKNDNGRGGTAQDSKLLQDKIFVHSSQNLNLSDHRVTSPLRGHFRLKAGDKIYVKVDPAKYMRDPMSNYFGIKLIQY